MKNATLQQIADAYITAGYGGSRLRKALAKDKDYQRLLKERKRLLTVKHKVTAQEMKRYVLSTDTDFKILAICKQIEKLRLSNHDKELVKLIKTQLEQEWRKPLVQQLNKLMRRYAR